MRVWGRTGRDIDLEVHVAAGAVARDLARVVEGARHVQRGGDRDAGLCGTHFQTVREVAVSCAQGRIASATGSANTTGKFMRSFGPYVSIMCSASLDAHRRVTKSSPLESNQNCSAVQPEFAGRC